MHSVEIQNDVLIVNIGEDLNNPKSNMAFNDFMKKTYEEHNSKKLVFSFANVVFIDSSGIKEIILAHRHQQNMGGVLACVELSPSLKELFEMVRLDKVFKIFPDRQSMFALMAEGD